MTRTVALPRRGTPSAGVAAPGDRRFRRPDVRPVGRRRIGLWCWQVGRVVFVVGVASAIGYGAASRILTSEWFRVGRVTVRGNVRASTIEIQSLIRDIKGEHILLVDLDDFRRRVTASPWVADATMRRLLPSTIEVRVAERTPIAIARVHERLYLLDEHGVLVDEFGPEHQEFDLPIVDGLVRQAEGGAAVDASRAELSRRFFAALRADDSPRRRISQVDVSDAADVVVLLEGDTVLVRLGDDRFAERLRTYQELAPALRQQLQEIDYVDMRFDARVYVKSKGRLAAAGR